jgi:hypothetical protein
LRGGQLPGSGKLADSGVPAKQFLTLQVGTPTVQTFDKVEV